MAFSPDQHLRNLKGQQYLDVKWRLMWLREEHPDAVIKTEMAHLDLDQDLAVFRAEVTIPGKGSASGYGSETKQDFPQGWVEKAETKAIGRALAALGFGTQFALELDEGDRVVDSPVTPRRPAPIAANDAGGTRGGSLKVVPERAVEERPAAGARPLERSDAERADTLRHDVVASLAADQDAAAKLPKSADDMTPQELEKTLSWLRNRAKRQA